VFCFFVVVSTLLLSVDPDFGFFRHLTHGDFPRRWFVAAQPGLNAA
jgi:hypothetical protein